MLSWRARILHFFNIRRDEGWLVKQLFFLQFFQGVGVALFFTAANALFLESFEIHELPKVYVLAAGLLWLTGFAYAQAEHRLSLKRLIPAVIVFMAFSIVALRAAIHQVNSSFLFLLLAWFNVLYLLSNLEFWGLSALLFDIRQSKRLFGIISAGDIPAKFIGYISASLVAPYIGSENMLFLAANSILLALLFWHHLAQRGKLDLHVAHGGHHHTEDLHGFDYANPRLARMISDFFGTPLILTVAILSFLVVACASIINFSFYAEVKENIHGDEQLAAFIGLFLAFGRIIALLFKLIFTGQVTNAFGLRGSLLITPVMLLIFAIAVVASPALSENNRTVLYVFGLMAVLSETLKTSLQDPVFIALMQPLRSHLRLKGHTIVKGVMDPFALLFSAGIISLQMYWSGTTDLRALSLVLIVMIAAWIAWIFVVDRNYLTTLVEGLQNRYLTGRETDINSESALRFTAQKLESGEVGEAIYLLELLEKQPGEKQQALILKALRHNDSRVRVEAMRVMGRLRLGIALPELHAVIKSHPDQMVLAEAIQTVCILQQEDVEDFSSYLDSENRLVVRAASIGLLKNGSINAVVAAGQKLQRLLESDDPLHRITAAEIIGELRVKSFYKSLLKLLNDADIKVVQAAITAAGQLQSEKLTPALTELLAKPALRRNAIAAIGNSGAAAIPAVTTYLEQQQPDANLRLKLMQQVAHIGSDAAQQQLLFWTKHYSEQRLELLHLLHASGFHTSPTHPDINLWMQEDLAQAERIVIQLQYASIHQHKPLAAALQLELVQLRDRLLWLFSFLYNRENVLRARNGFLIQKKESLANAFELIELTVPKEIASRFTQIFEQGAENHKNLHKTNAVTDDAQLWEACLTPALPYNRWTRAVALYTMPRYLDQRYQPLLQNYLHHSDTLLRETAAAVVNNSIAV
ncbi:MAG: HEAT repeat domain-containing protein [Chitinophagales bacterium]